MYLAVLRVTFCPGVGPVEVLNVLVLWPFSLTRDRKKGSALVSAGCEPPCGCWKLSSNPLQEEQVFITAKPLKFLILF